MLKGKSRSGPVSLFMSPCEALSALHWGREQAPVSCWIWPIPLSYLLSRLCLRSGWPLCSLDTQVTVSPQDLCSRSALLGHVPSYLPEAPSFSSSLDSQEFPPYRHLVSVSRSTASSPWKMLCPFLITVFSCLSPPTRKERPSWERGLVSVSLDSEASTLPSPEWEFSKCFVSLFLNFIFFIYFWLPLGLHCRARASHCGRFSYCGDRL